MLSRRTVLSPEPPSVASGEKTARTASNSAYWGGWPQSFVNFQQATGLGSYWYSSGGAADDEKPQDPVTVGYSLNP